MLIDNLILILNYVFAASMPVTHIGGYAAAILSAAFIWKYGDNIIKEPVFRWLLVFFLYGMLLMPFSREPKIGLGAMTGCMTHWILPFALGYGISTVKNSRRALMVYFTLLSAVVGLSLLAYFGLFPKVVHGNFFLVEDGLLKVGRSHIAFGALCIFTAFFLTGFALERNRGFWGKAALICAALVYVFALVLSGSRGYYIAAGVTFTSFGIYWAFRNKKLKYLLVAAALVLACLMLVLKFNPEVRKRVTQTNFAEQNIYERMYLYKVALLEIKTRPFFGYGPGQAIRQKEFFASLPEAERNLDRHPALHSFYLNLAADFGLAGAAIFVIIIALIFKRILAVLRSDGPVNAFAFGLFWGLIGLLIGDCFDTILRGPGVAMELFWALGMVFRLSKESKGDTLK